MDPPNALGKRASHKNPPGRDEVANIDRALTNWLGLVTTHRRFFDASQDGWLRPLSGSDFLLGHESFVSENFPAGPNIIPVRLMFDVNELPFPDARKDLERNATRRDHKDVPRVVHWRTPIPLHAVKMVEVSSTEHKTRLLAIADQTSNVSFPDTDIVVNEFAVQPTAISGPATWATESEELPETLNSIHGAMAMAVWAVPHVDPWIEVLQQALSGDAIAAESGAGKLDAQWFQLPWLICDRSGSSRDNEDDQGQLWRAALSCMQWSTLEENSPIALAESIAKAASLDRTNRTAETWLARTRRIIAADNTITCDDWRLNGAGLAIQLALLRPEPMTFRDWNRDLPGLPPGVWWAAAALCGWRHGYRALDKKFRGDAALQEFLATRALAASLRGDVSAALPPSQHSSLERTHEHGRFTLTWRGHPVIHKLWYSRAKWYTTDLNDLVAGRAARDIANRLQWPCIVRVLLLSSGSVQISGGGRVSIEGDALVVEGEVSLRLPQGVEVEELVDPDEFRRRLATEAGVVPDPSEAAPPLPATEVTVVPDPLKVSHGQPNGGPPGLMYRPDFITEDEEAKLLDCIDRGEWSAELQRRVQQYGWRYDYGKSRIDQSMRVGELPEWAQELGRRLVNEGLMKKLPDQLIVNEYCGKQGISSHVDKTDDFSEHVATISLLETWDMVFRRIGSKEKVEKTLERRSVAVLTGDARYKWKHEIPIRATEGKIDHKGIRRRVKRSRRISLTFRKTSLSHE